MNHCGACRHAHPIPGDLTQRVCRGAPPQVVVIQGPPILVTGMPPQIQLQIKTVWPNVGIAEIGCSLFARAEEKFDVLALSQEPGTINFVPDTN